MRNTQNYLDNLLTHKAGMHNCDFFKSKLCIPCCIYYTNFLVDYITLLPSLEHNCKGIIKNMIKHPFGSAQTNNIGPHTLFSKQADDNMRSTTYEVDIINSRSSASSQITRDAKAIPASCKTLGFVCVSRVLPRLLRNFVRFLRLSQISKGATASKRS